MVEGMDKVPPIQLIGGLPTLLTRHHLELLCAMSNQDQVLGAAQAQLSFAAQEEAFAEILSGLSPSIADTLRQAIATMLDRQPFQGLARGRQPEPSLRLRSLFPLSRQEGAIHFRQNDPP